jgi:hypothetical protein
MKNRNGFVSNSSTTSFVCDICNTSESGKDATERDFDMVSCENGHVFHLACLAPANETELRAILDDAEVRDNEDYDAADENQIRYGEYLFCLPERYCPICQFKEVSNQEILRYIFKYLVSKEELLARIKKEFKTYPNFQGAI